MPGGRKRVPAAAAKALLQRLGTYVEGRFGTWERFARATKVPRTTADRWRLGGAVPDLPQLLRLARRDPLLDLHYLLTGRRATGWLRAEEVEGLLANLDAAMLQSRKLRLPSRPKKRAPQRRRKP